MNLFRPVSLAVFLARVALLAAALVAAGCQVTRHAEPTPPEPPPPPQIQDPVATHKFRFDPEHDEVVGELQITHVQGEDTLPDIARRFNVGYEEILRANPGVDPWLPGVGRAIVVPTQFVLPDAPREGLVVNLAQLRVFYYPKPAKLKKGEVDDGLRTVITHPIGIGKIGWQTPEGSTKVTSKQKNPTWTPPVSVRKEHKENGDPLPARVPPGPDNPLGAYKMTLGWPSYLVHGTNKPYGVGMRSSHGCIRFYPEDIAQLYDQIPVGTKVTVVNQPFVFGWHRDAMYVQAFPILEDDDREHPKAAETLLNAGISDEMWQKLKQHNVAVDLDLVNETGRAAARHRHACVTPEHDGRDVSRGRSPCRESRPARGHLERLRRRPVPRRTIRSAAQRQADPEEAAAESQKDCRQACWRRQRLLNPALVATGCPLEPAAARPHIVRSIAAFEPSSIAFPDLLTPISAGTETGTREST